MPPTFQQGWRHLVYAEVIPFNQGYIIKAISPRQLYHEGYIIKALASRGYSRYSVLLSRL